MSQIRPAFFCLQSGFRISNYSRALQPFAQRYSNRAAVHRSDTVVDSTKWDMHKYMAFQLLEVSANKKRQGHEDYASQTSWKDNVGTHVDSMVTAMSLFDNLYNLSFKLAPGVTHRELVDAVAKHPTLAEELDLPKGQRQAGVFTYDLAPYKAFFKLGNSLDTQITRELWKHKVAEHINDIINGESTNTAGSHTEIQMRQRAFWKSRWSENSPHGPPQSSLDLLTDALDLFDSTDYRGNQYMSHQELIIAIARHPSLTSGLNLPPIEYVNGSVNGSYDMAAYKVFFSLGMSIDTRITRDEWHQRVAKHINDNRHDDSEEF